MKKDGFFGSTHIYPTIWTIIITALGFFGGLLWKKFSGPEKVVVMNRDVQDNSNDTTISVIEFKPDEDYFNHITNLTSKSIIQEYSSNPSKQSVEDISLEIAKEYQQKFDSIITSRQNSVRPQSNSTGKANQPNQSKLQRPKFKMPAVVEGYTHGSLNSLATIKINATEFKKEDFAKLSVNFFSGSVLDDITPLFVDIVEKKTENRFYQIWSEQYELGRANNTISFSTDFKKGKYDLKVGFYRLDELNRKYPSFYFKKFTIVIK